MTRPTQSRSTLLGCLCASFTFITAAVADPPDCPNARGAINAQYLSSVDLNPTPISCASESYVEVQPDGSVKWVTSPDHSTNTDDFLPSACWWRLTGAPVTTAPPTNHDEYYGVGRADLSGYQALNDYAIWAPMGYAENYNRLASPGVGDFLPAGTTVGMSTTALVPNAAVDQPTGWHEMTRPTVHGEVDLITGVPLTKVTDMELEFGGATFRLARTRSATRFPNRLGSGFINGHGGSRPFSEGAWWDWVGNGWMTSENPILLIDSALPDVDGDNPRTTRLVLDAHHSIPFQFLPDVGQYEAPPRFRARLRHNGTFSAGSWTTRPTQYEVLLYDGALRYTFVAIYDDVPPNQWDADYATGGSAFYHEDSSSYHDRPLLPGGAIEQYHAATHDPWNPLKNPGLGVPHYGICTKIEDQYGHSVNIEYCKVKRRAIDDAYTTGCEECLQHCLSKGQIRKIELKDGDTVRWTLVYVHRAFRTNASAAWSHIDTDALFPNLEYIYDDFPHDDAMGDPIVANADVYEAHGSLGIDRIYVYDHEDPDVSIPLDTSYDCRSDTVTELTIPHTGPLDAATEAGPLPAGWTYQVRYHYMPKDEFGASFYPPVLRKTTVIRPDDDDQDSLPERQSTRVFHYSNLPAVASTGSSGDLIVPWLEHIFEGEDIGRLNEAYDAGALKDEDGTVINTGLVLDEDTLSYWGAADGLGGDRPNYTGAEFAIGSYASRWFQAPVVSSWPTGPTDTMPGASSITSQYVTRTANQLVFDNIAGTVAACTVPDGDGAERFYRVHRLAVLPAEFAYGTSMHTSRLEVLLLNRGAYRSAFFHPFAWWPHAAYGPDPLQPAVQKYLQGTELPATDLKQPRWIAIVDEFGSAEERDSSSSYTSPNATKTGQIARRVVEINAAGYVLREREWQFTDEGTLYSGSGLGEDYIYESISDYFTPTGGFDDEVPAGHLQSQLLVEKRSVGWSAAELDQGIDEAQNGLIEFFEYHQEGLEDGQTIDETLVPWGLRVQLVAQGIMRGTSGTKYYTRDILRDWAGTQSHDGTPRPQEVLADIEYLSPSAIRQTAVPTPSGAPPADVKATIYRSIWSAREQDEAEADRELESRITITAPRKLDPDPTSHWYYPVNLKVYDDRGNEVWAATGQLRDADDPTAHTDDNQRLSLTYYHRNDDGEVQFTVGDTEPGETEADLTHHDDLNTSGFPASVPSDGLPTGWTARIGPGDPLNYCIGYARDFVYGLSDIFYPNQRRFVRRVITTHNVDLDEEVTREFILRDVVKVNGQLRSLSPGEVNDYTEPPLGIAIFEPGSSQISLGRPWPTYGMKGMNGLMQKAAVYHTVFGPDGIEGDRGLPPTPSIQREVTFSNPVDLDIADDTQPVYTERAQVKLQPDSRGRLRRLELLEPDGLGGLVAVGTRDTNDLGEVYRDRDIDGTIARVTRNALGQELRVYVGTDDSDWIDPGAPSGNQNMVLKSRLMYGSGVNDAWMPTVQRYYRSTPSWHGTNYSDYFEPPAGVDDEGYSIATAYDWRMRPVRVHQYDRGEDPESAQAIPSATQLTYLDFLGRPRFEVTLGRGAVTFPSAQLDPTVRVPGDAAIDVADLYDVTPRPLSITETVYATDGTPTEQYSYDMDWVGVGVPTRMVAYNYTGQGGAVVYSQSPNAPRIVRELDALGREVSIIQMRPVAPGTDYELQRTDFVYDFDGNVTEVTSLVRTDFSLGSNSSLVASDGVVVGNAVRTRTFRWHDEQNRLIASAELGTENTSADTYTNNTATISRPSTAPSWNGSAIIAHVSLADARIRVIQYNEDGDVSLRVMPDGTTESFDYDDAGRLATHTKNSSDPVAANRQATEYSYKLGRLESITSRRVEPGGTDDIDETLLTYGADILDAITDVNDEETGYDTSSPSRTNGLVGKVQKSYGSTPADQQTPAHFTFRYNRNGQIAERIDARGVVLRHLYDEFGRLSKVIVGNYDSATFAAGYPQSMDTGLGDPPDRIGYVEYAYDDRHRLQHIFARESETGPVVAHNRLDYDDRDQLIRDWQSLGGYVDLLATPHTEYSWEYEATDLASAGPGHHRLTAIDYPVHPSIQARIVTFQYGSAGDDDDLLSRISAIDTNFGPSDVADFVYYGVDQRRSMSTGDALIAQTWDLDPLSVGLEGLDRFGQLKDLHYKNDAGATLFRAQHTYDAVGQRLASRVTQAPYLGSSRDNKRSSLFAYDALHRLTSSNVGELNTTNDAMAVSERLDTWALDLLGNWDSVLGGKASSGNLDGYGHPWALPGADSGSDSATLKHTIAPQNEFSSIELVEDSGTTTVTPEYDEVGNLVFDGKYLYQYDAWNRLIQVNFATGTGINDIDETVKNFTYDGLGRLARTQSPYPDPLTANDDIRTERFYYDGLRRIQELTIDPVVGVGTGMASQNTELQSVLAETVPNPEELDPSGATSAFETGQMGMGAGAPVTYLCREYIWGPGDNGLDELIVQYDENGDDWWALQDGSGDVVALCDLDGGFLTPDARVVAQWSYDPYGNPIAREQIHPFAELHLGHKGLFAARIDAGIAQSSGGPETPRITPYADLLYHNRNRTFAPAHGRFLQKDPNGTGATHIANSYHHGERSAYPLHAFGLSRWYGDGSNLYQYIGSNPANADDPLGLYFGGIVGALSTSASMADMASGAMEQASMTISLGLGLLLMINEYTVNQQIDAHWAGDMELPDEMYSGTPVLKNSAVPKVNQPHYPSASKWKPFRGLFKRGHGGPAHNDMTHSFGSAYAKALGNDRYVRFNQAFSNPRTGKTIRFGKHGQIYRPDLQILIPPGKFGAGGKGRILVVEVVDTNPVKAGRMDEYRDWAETNGYEFESIEIRLQDGIPHDIRYQ